MLPSQYSVEKSGCAEKLEPPAHLVQFCSDNQTLLKNVIGYLGTGLNQGDALLIIASAERNAAFVQGLRESGADPEAAMRERRLLFADAEQTLKRFMVDGQPDWSRFQRTIGTLIREVEPRPGHAGLRAYGEMVGILWKAGRLSSAIRVEQFWNRLMSANSFHLFCSYPIDLFGKDVDAARIEPLLSAHTELVAGHDKGDLPRAIARAMEEVLGPDAAELRAGHASNAPAWPTMPEAEGAILWLRSNFPSRADHILERARRYLEAATVIEHPRESVQ